MTPLPDTVTFTTNAGDHGSLALSHDWHADIEAALEFEIHPNDDQSDHANALEQGFPLVAAYLLHGATETPALAAVRQAYMDAGAIPEGLDYATSSALLEGPWKAWHDEHARVCESCNSVTYANPEEPENCGSCLAPLMRDYVFVAVIRHRTNRRGNDAYEQFAKDELDDSTLFLGGPFPATQPMIHDANYDVVVTYDGRELETEDD